MSDATNALAHAWFPPQQCGARRPRRPACSIQVELEGCKELDIWYLLHQTGRRSVTDIVPSYALHVKRITTE
jgi:hypothetical protein